MDLVGGKYRRQGAKSELKNLAEVDVHQLCLTNFYFA